MRSTLIIPDALYARLKRRAAESGQTISNLVTEFVRRGLDDAGSETGELPPLPSFADSDLLIDIHDRRAVDESVERHRDARLYGRGPDD